MDNPSILVVDDEKITAFYLKDILAAANYEVHLAQNGEEALEQLGRRRFDLVITDLVMPGIDGFALVRRVKQTQPGLPVFILTAHGSYDVARKAQIIGADDYLLKPVNPDQLHAALAKTFEKGARAKSGPLAKLPIDGHAIHNFGSDAGSLPPHREGPPFPRHRAHPGRKRHGQRARGARHLRSGSGRRP
jgi:DNA-binding NtrC family response regulator